ncbi:amino acid ABC transporter substrate-binding protein [Alcaligenaceae bacterium]|nr:amino acid ABC transporter substrate-binding protein [Alcaligenaceae bacterium]
MALLHAALRAAGFAANLSAAPNSSEARNLHETTSGRTHITLLPPTPTRLSMVNEGRLRMIAAPLERGLLGWRVSFVLQDQRRKTAGIRDLTDFQKLTVGQGSGWIDAHIYRQAGIITRELQAWRNGEFTGQMRSGLIDVFPMGLEESVSYFLPHFRQHHPEVALDEHLLLRYPWYRFVWVTSAPEADGLYQALQDGFDVICGNGQFESIWAADRHVPSASHWQGRTIIKLKNPFYSQDIIPQRYQHLLLDPSIS